MSVELPKDAEGREIPLDTRRLYNKNGKRKTVLWFEYSPTLKHWTVVLDEGLNVATSATSVSHFYLTPPDSWEALEEDLSRAAKRDAITSQCRYFNTTDRCVNCPIHNGDGGCTHKDERAFGDILSRIRKLRGESGA